MTIRTRIKGAVDLPLVGTSQCARCKPDPDVGIRCCQPAVTLWSGPLAAGHSVRRGVAEREAEISGVVAPLLIYAPLSQEE